jgi:hypothetical protein
MVICEVITTTAIAIAKFAVVERGNMFGTLWMEKSIG